MATIDKTERILNLISFLLKSRQPVSWRNIRSEVEGYNSPAERNESVERRFERDKNAIRSLGVSVQYTSDDGNGNEGYFIEKRDFFLPRIELDPEEITMLAIAGRAALPRSGDAFGANLRSALAKLEFDSPIPGEVRSTVEERYLFYHPSLEDNSLEGPKLDVLTSATLANKTVSFSYSGSDGVGARGASLCSLDYAGGGRVTASAASVKTDGVGLPRLVDPYGMAFWAGHWYLTGHCHDREAIRTFRVDRMGRDVKVRREGGGADFRPPDDFDIEQHVGTPPWQLTRGRTTRVTVRFDSIIAWMVREQPQRMDKWSDQRDGSAVLERTVADSAAFMRWLLGFGAHAELVAPAEMRDEFAAKVARIRSLYAGSSADRADEAGKRT